MSTLLKMQKIHPLCSRCIGMYPLQNRWTVLRYLQCYENFSECCTHLILPETALFSPTPTFAKEPLYLASGGTKGDAKSWDKTFLKSRESASAQLYFRLDMPFRRWLAGITPEEVDSADYETEERVFSAWQKTAKTIAYSCAEELAMHAGDAAMVGHEIKNEKSGDSVRYSAPKAIHQFRIQVAEIYKKI